MYQPVSGVHHNGFLGMLYIQFATTYIAGAVVKVFNEFRMRTSKDKVMDITVEWSPK